MSKIQNIVYGSSGLIGSSFAKINNSKKNYIFFSRKKEKYYKFQDLDKKINFAKSEIKKVNIFFLQVLLLLKKIIKKKL